MKVLITGGAGFVGSSLAFALKDKYCASEVVVLDNLRRRGSELNVSKFKSHDIKFIHGDIRNFSDFSTLESNFDVLIEASAEPSILSGTDGNPSYLLDTNLLGSVNCLEFARKRVGLFVFLSTSRVYSIGPLRQLPLVEDDNRFNLNIKGHLSGLTGRGITEDFPVHSARSLYGATKLASEYLIQEYAFNFGLDCIINRCGVIAGPGQFGKVDQGIFTLWVANHYFRKPLKYTGFGGMGKQVRDLLHPQDLFELLVAQVEGYGGKAIRGTAEIYNVGGGPLISTSLRELTQHCESVVGKTVEILSEAVSPIVDVPWYVTDSSKVAKRYNWRPVRSVRTIVEEIYGWLRENEVQLKSIFI